MMIKPADRYVANDRLGEKQPFGQAVLGHIANASLRRSNGITKGNVFAGQGDAALAGCNQSKQRFRQRCPATPQHAGNAKHLSCFQLKIYVLKGSFLAKLIHNKQSFSPINIEWWLGLRNIAPRHMAGQ